jgi:hypothetical protein
MSKTGRLLDLLLRGLICLSPMGAIAYYSACAESDSTPRDWARARRRALVSNPIKGAAVIPLARS